ncbi:hypothetical protein MUK42_34517 [Musa troglodytarum]|uniref:Uncharacterized protein n=1 Tax=Musa troglodytarum TaxID=320322 RepID=A0A9E7F8N5_9LILI|nr:hypothetical protein MUK42_34517 [Musa troglodytarum]
MPAPPPSSTPSLPLQCPGVRQSLWNLSHCCDTNYVLLLHKELVCFGNAQLSDLSTPPNNPTFKAHVLTSEAAAGMDRDQRRFHAL